VLAPTSFPGDAKPNSGLTVDFGPAEDIAAKFRALATLLAPANDINYTDAVGIDISVADQPVILRPIPEQPGAFTDESPIPDGGQQSASGGDATGQAT
jgi:hypothetical protein